MPTNTQPADSGQTTGPGDANANVQGDADSQNSLSAQDLFNSLKGLPEFQKYVASQAQSKHDKRIGKIENKQEGFEGQLARFTSLTDGGLSPEVAMQFMELQGEQAQPAVVETETDPTKVPVAGQPAGQEVPNVQAVITAMGLQNDVRAQNVIKEGGDYAYQVGRLANIAAAGAVQANPAAVMPVVQGQPVQQQTLFQQYEARRDAIGLGNPQAIIELQTEFRALGLNI